MRDTTVSMCCFIGGTNYDTTLLYNVLLVCMLFIYNLACRIYIFICFHIIYVKWYLKGIVGDFWKCTYFLSFQE